MSNTSTPLPKYCSLQNAKNKEFRCNHAKSLETDYTSPECLMRLIPGGEEEDLYAIRNEDNGQFFQDTIGSMSSQISSNAQLWYIRPYPGIEKGYTIQNAANKEYMTNKAGSLYNDDHGKKPPGEAQVWIIEDRQVLVKEDLANSYYASLQNFKNDEYRYDKASKLSGDMVIPTCLFKMIKLDNGRYGIQNQGNYEFYQSHIRTMASGIADEGQEWNVELVKGQKEELYTLQNAKNGEYMTNNAGSLYNAKKQPPGEGEYWRIKKYPYLESASWMGDNWDLLKNKPLNKICIPGSHDSGTYDHSALTGCGWVGNTKTQIFDIQMQLMQGIRVFDIRPTLHNGNFYTYHASKVAAKLQGAIGPNMEEIFAQIRAFANNPKHKHELIVLNISHAMRWSGAGYQFALTNNQKQQFIKLVKSELGDLLIRGKATQLTEKTCGELLNNTATVICRLADEEFDTTAAETEEGIWGSRYFNMKGSYSDTNSPEEMIYTKGGPENQSQLTQLQNSNRNFVSNQYSFMFELCWQLTLNGLQSTFDTPSIIDLANKVNPMLYPTLNNWMADQVINKTIYPNIINTDACQESATKAIKVCIEIMKHIE